MTPPPESAVVYRLGPDIVTRNIAGEHLLVPVRSGLADLDYLYTTDEVGSFIVAALDGRRDVAAVARQVSAAFDVDMGRACADVAAFLAELLGAGLVLRGDVAP